MGAGAEGAACAGAGGAACAGAEGSLRTGAGGAVRAVAGGILRPGAGGNLRAAGAAVSRTATAGLLRAAATVFGGAARSPGAPAPGVPGSRALAAGEGYTEDGSFVLPIDATGDYFVIVVTDAAGQVRELNAETNNTVSAPLTVALAPYAQLAVSDVSAPAISIGDPVAVTI
ncbi:MAG TPA: CARDB domain-containing protein, partial [Rubrivivax sp.]|nr:CARDB domain-containing protein [Rubrivivax sp.]